MNERSMSGQVALITGGGSGVGAEAARALNERGVRTVITGRREKRLRTVNESLASPGMMIAVDITREDGPTQLVEQTVERFGRLDVVVHAAGVFERRSITETDQDFLEAVMEVNLSAVVALSRAAWSHLSASGGQIVLISSAAALRGFPQNTAYAASKGAMNAVGEVLREEGRSEGIRVLTLCPAQIDTELWDGKAPTDVRVRMMRATGVGELVASLLATDRSIDFAPISIQPPANPWTEPL